MEIKETDKKENVYFSSLSPGDIFKFRDRFYFRNGTFNVAGVPYANCTHLKSAKLENLRGDDVIIFYPNAFLVTGKPRL